jgi:hypothetical protein
VATSPAWPAGCASGCSSGQAASRGHKLRFTRQAGEPAFDEYVSDPAKPVPFRARPIRPVGYDNGLTWPQWLVDDQREASGRPDVLAFVSDVLSAPLKISGQPVANLVAYQRHGPDWEEYDRPPDEAPPPGCYRHGVPTPAVYLRPETASWPPAIAAYRFAPPTASRFPRTADYNQ